MFKEKQVFFSEQKLFEVELLTRNILSVKLTGSEFSKTNSKEKKKSRKVK